ncbi:MAG: hypothetical protein HOV81_32345 [Kofleriaceae bacterium]|nr:hypothetical protein [Kofleriaceae bacterium]
MRVLSLLVLGLTACANQHITVPPLPAHPTPELRLDTWRHWHSRAQGVELETRCNRNGCSTSKTAMLQLEGGVVVRHPEDLRPLIDERSDSARALTRLEHAKSKRRTYKLVAYAGVLGFFASCVMAMKNESANWFFYGGGAGLGVTVAGSIGAWLQSDDILAASTSVFDGYDKALAQRLELCVKGLSLVPCEMETPGTMSVPVDDAGGDAAIQALPQR